MYGRVSFAYMFFFVVRGLLCAGVSENECRIVVIYCKVATLYKTFLSISRPLENSKRQPRCRGPLAEQDISAVGADAYGTYMHARHLLYGLVVTDEVRRQVVVVAYTF